MTTANSTFGTTGLVSEVTVTIQVKSTNEGDQDFSFSLSNTSLANRLMRAMSLTTAQGLAQGVSLSSGTKWLVHVPTTGSANLRMTGSTADAGITISSAMPSFLPLAQGTTLSPLYYQVGGSAFVLRILGL